MVDCDAKRTSRAMSGVEATSLGIPERVSLAVGEAELDVSLGVWRSATELEPAALGGILQTILGSESLVAQVVAQSYVHENGFLKIVIARDMNGRALRLHRWAGHAENRGNIHNHRWNFRSRILEGVLSFDEFSIASGAGRSLRRYEYLGGNMREALTCASARVRRAATGSRVAGEKYAMSATTLHRTWAQGDTPTLTVVARGPTLLNRADVLKPNNARDNRGQATEGAIVQALHRAGSLTR